MLPRILVVDDQQANLYVMKSLLNRLECDFSLLDSGYAAVDAAKESNFSLALIDVRMPGMNGFETAKALTRIQPGLPIIFITAEPKDELKIKSAERNGAVDLLYKPIDRRLLLNKVKQYIDKDGEFSRPEGSTTVRDEPPLIKHSQELDQLSEILRHYLVSNQDSADKTLQFLMVGDAEVQTSIREVASRLDEISNHLSAGKGRPDDSDSSTSNRPDEVSVK